MMHIMRGLGLLIEWSNFDGLRAFVQRLRP
jgi:hypothetical protein